MAKVKHHQASILRVLEPIRAWKTPYADVRYEVIVDLEHQHFQVVVTGWDGSKRVHSMLGWSSVHDYTRENDLKGLQNDDKLTI